jgi:glycosyltransferase involved in cell wall biosynthesis
MKILHLDTERGWRGGERQAFLLATALAAKGHQNVMACRPGTPMEEKAKNAGLPVLSISPWMELDPFTAARLRRYIRDNGVDIVHAHTGHTVGLGALATVGTRAKLLATRRVDFPLRRNVFTRWKYGRVNTVACISSIAKRMVLAGGVPEERTVMIPSGIDSSSYPSAADREKLRRDRKISLHDVVLVHVGALVPHKDQATLLKAVQRVVWEESRLKVFILGDGPLREPLERLARDLGVAERVFFLGHLPEAVSYTALADIFVFSSKEEGLGTALLDALAIGVPTAATAGGGIPDLYGGPGAPELTPPGDAEALAQNILSVLNDPAEAGRRITRGRERAMLFTVDSMVSRYERLYEKIKAS